MKASVGTVGDSYDNALAESIIGLYKTEVIARQGWCGAGDVELSTLEWVDWFCLIQSIRPPMCGAVHLLQAVEQAFIE